MRMARVNIYLPDDLARASREAGFNVSSLTQQALRHALAAQATDRWLESVVAASTTGVTHEQVLRALEEAREDLGRKGG
jgi:post-segregation antitoxin (ccd killing protein)